MITTMTLIGRKQITSTNSKKMTYKELLDSTPFEEIEPYLRQHPGIEGCNLCWYRLHYDMLRSLTPKIHLNSNSLYCIVRMEQWEESYRPIPDVHPLEGDVWEHSLTKELKLEPDVNCAWAEIAASCLWHTSFYGFVPKDISDTVALRERDKDEYHYSKELAMRNICQIHRAGGYVSSMQELPRSKKQGLIAETKIRLFHGSTPINRAKRKRNFRRQLMTLYYERINAISDFIIGVLPSLKDKQNNLTINRLCGLFHSTLFAMLELPSFVRDDMNMSGASYLETLIRRYHVIRNDDETFRRVVIHLTTGNYHESLTSDEQSLCDSIMEDGPFESRDIILSTDPSLGKQVLLRLALFNSENPLVQ